MDNQEIDMEKVMKILVKDNPREVERAMLIVRNMDLEEQNQALAAALAKQQGATDGDSD